MWAGPSKKCLPWKHWVCGIGIHCLQQKGWRVESGSSGSFLRSGLDSPVAKKMQESQYHTSCMTNPTPKILCTRWASQPLFQAHWCIWDASISDNLAVMNASTVQLCLNLFHRILDSKVPQAIIPLLFGSLNGGKIQWSPGFLTASVVCCRDRVGFKVLLLAP